MALRQPFQTAEIGVKTARRRESFLAVSGRLTPDKHRTVFPLDSRTADAEQPAYRFDLAS
jgi:hypothetical protein